MFVAVLICLVVAGIEGVDPCGEVGRFGLAVLIDVCEAVEFAAHDERPVLTTSGDEEVDELVAVDIANADSTRLLQALGEECIAALPEQEKTLLKNVLS